MRERAAAQSRATLNLHAPALAPSFPCRASWIERGPPNPPPGGEYCPSSDPICAPTPGAGLSARQRREGQSRLKDLYRVLAPALLDAGLVDVEHSGEGKTTTRIERSAAMRSGPEVLTAAVLSHLRRILSGAAQREPVPSTVHPALRAPRLTAGWTARRESDTEPEAVAALLLSVLEGAGAGTLLRSLAPSGASAVATAYAFLDAAERIAAARAAHRTAAPTPRTAGASAPIELQPSFVLAGVIPLEYAGAALASGDFDGDGEVDLVATAPGHSSLGAAAQKLPQSGAFYVRYGGNFSGHLRRAEAAASAPPVPEPLALDFSALTEGTRALERLGAAACVLDANLDGVDDLAVSAPSSGFDWFADVSPRSRT